MQLDQRERNPNLEDAMEEVQISELFEFFAMDYGVKVRSVGRKIKKYWTSEQV